VYSQIKKDPSGKKPEAVLLDDNSRVLLLWENAFVNNEINIE
jgi:hypothetical protein